MRSYKIGQGEKRVITVEFANLIPEGVAITGAPRVHVENFTTGVLVETGFTISNEQVQGTDVLLELAVAEDVPTGHYGLEVEVTLDNGEEVQNRDAGGYLMRLVVRH